MKLHLKQMMALYYSHSFSIVQPLLLDNKYERKMSLNGFSYFEHKSRILVCQNNLRR